MSTDDKPRHANHLVALQDRLFAGITQFRAARC